MFDFAEEPFDEVAIAVKERAEGRHVDPSWHRLDVGPSTTICQGLTQGVTVVGSISKEGLTGADVVEHVTSAPAVMRLAFGQLEGNRIAVGIDKGMDLRRQPAPRAPHASGWSVVPFVGFRWTPF